MSKINQRLFVVFVLGFSSGLPLALLTGTLQAWFASSGVSILTTGLLSILGIPYLYRILFAPIVDRYFLQGFGRRRSWMLFMQIGLIIGFNGMAWCNPLHSPALISLIAFVLACLSAIQDSVIDAQRVEYLPQKFHALAATYSVFGYRLALLVGGAFSLILSTLIGWVLTYQLMGCLLIFGMLATLFSSEPQLSLDSTAAFSSSFTQPFKELMARPSIISLCLFIIFYKMGEAFTTSTSGIMMPFLIQNLGFSLAVVGYVNKLLGLISLLLGGLIAGIMLVRYSLYRALLIFGLLQAFSNLLFLWLALVGKNTLLLAFAVGCDNLVCGMGTTALVTLLMRVVNPKYTAAQFSLFVSIASLPRVFSGPIAAFLQINLGWVGLYELAFFMAFLYIPFLFRIKDTICVQTCEPELKTFSQLVS